MADRYTLVIETDPRSLPGMAERRLKTVIAKHGLTASPDVAWLAWEPSACDTIVWQEIYGLYAGRVAREHRDVVRVVAAVVPAVVRAVHPYTASGFGTPRHETQIPRHHYEVRNESSATVTFGLLQSATINGRAVRSPLNAVGVATRHEADFTELTTISIWSQSGVESGGIVSVPASATVMTFHERRLSERLVYDAGTGRYVPLSRPRTPASERLPRPPLRHSRSSVRSTPARSIRRKEAHGLGCRPPDRSNSAVW